MQSRGQWIASRVLNLSKSSAFPNAKKTFLSKTFYYLYFLLYKDMTVIAGVKNATFSSSLIKSQPTLSDRLCTKTKMTAQLVFETKPLQTHLWIYRYNVD